jgi:predicted dehydrogenase
MGVCDLSESRRQRAAAELGIPAYSDIAELIEGAQPEIVVVATQPDARVDLIPPIAASESVRAIVGEKPLALSMDEAEEIVAAADRGGVQLSVCHQLRFTPHFTALQESIDRAELGTIEFIRALSYGHLLDQGAHLVDAVRALTGGGRVLWAMSQGYAQSSPPGSQQQADVPAWTTHHLALEGGIRCTLETGPLHQRSERFGLGEEEIDDYLDKRLTVIGSRGVAQFVTGGDCRVLTEDSADWRTYPGGVARAVSATRLFHEEVRDSLLDGTDHRADAHDALHSLEGLLACAQSATAGGAVRLPLDRDVERPALRSRPDDLEASVILPLPDHRGYATKAVSSWTEGQTFDRDRFEVIVASDGAEPGLEESVEPLLGPRDRLIRAAGVEEVELYDSAARVARGRIVIFT